MGNESEYQRRAKNCFERAEMVKNSIDRRRWLQLAEEWLALSRMPPPKATLFRNKPIRSLRGEPPSNTKSPEADHTRPFLENAPPFAERRRGD
jgi:hypothetical protein